MQPPDFSPFVDFTKLTDDEIIERMTKANNMIAYYYWTPYNYLVPQLQGWRDSCMEELKTRAEKRRKDKIRNKDNNNVVFDNSEEEMDRLKKEKEDKEKQP
jgi:ferritin-like protein